MAAIRTAAVMKKITSAVDLFDKAVDAFNQARDSIESLRNPNSIDLADAQSKLTAAKDRAARAHQSLEEAIAARIGKE